MPRPRVVRAKVVSDPVKSQVFGGVVKAFPECGPLRTAPWRTTLAWHANRGSFRDRTGSLSP